jgi:hypothetical protein
MWRSVRRSTLKKNWTSSSRLRRPSILAVEGLRRTGVCVLTCCRDATIRAGRLRILGYRSASTTVPRVSTSLLFTMGIHRNRGVNMAPKPKRRKQKGSKQPDPLEMGQLIQLTREDLHDLSRQVGQIMIDICSNLRTMRRQGEDPLKWRDPA